MTNLNGSNSQDTPVVTVDLRRRMDAKGQVLAHADVQVNFGTFGIIDMFGFAVFQSDNGGFIVFPPAQKGERRSFPHVKLRGWIRELIESAILSEFGKVPPGAPS